MRDRIYSGGLVLLLISFMACSNHPLPKTFLIPADVEGRIRIVGEEKCGTKSKEENGRQVFEFQKNGFLIVNFDLVSIGETDDFYLVDSKGNKTKVTQFSNFKDRVENRPAIIVGDVGVTDMSSTNINATTVSTAIAFQEFHLYNKHTMEMKKDFFEHEIDSLTKSVVYACRAN